MVVAEIVAVEAAQSKNNSELQTTSLAEEEVNIAEA